MSRSVGSNNMLPPVVCQRVRGFFSVPGAELVEERRFRGFLAPPWYLVHLGDASFASHPPCVYKAWVSKICLLLDMPFGQRSVEALSLLPWGECLKIHKNCLQIFLDVCGIYDVGALLLASVGQPSLHGNYACMVYWIAGTFRRNCRQKQGKTFFSPSRVFLFSRNSVRNHTP